MSCVVLRLFLYVRFFKAKLRGERSQVRQLRTCTILLSFRLCSLTFDALQEANHRATRGKAHLGKSVLLRLVLLRRHKLPAFVLFFLVEVDKASLFRVIGINTRLLLLFRAEKNERGRPAHSKRLDSFTINLEFVDVVLDYFDCSSHSTDVGD